MVAETGIRTASGIMQSASYRFHVAHVPRIATVAMMYALKDPGLVDGERLV
jgi:hypothetical protein